MRFGGGGGDCGCGRNLFMSFMLQVYIDDAWRWDPDPIAGYSY